MPVTRRSADVPRPSRPRLAQRLAAASAACVLGPTSFNAGARLSGFAPRSLAPPGLECVAPARQKEPVPAAPASQLADGLLQGGDAFAYDPRWAHVDDVPPVRPTDASRATGETMLYVNGAWTSTDGALADMQRLADVTGHNVVGVVNASGGWANLAEFSKDAVQAAGDKLGVGENKAKNTVANLLCQAVAARRQLHVVGQSQGAAIVGRALFEVDAAMAAQQGAVFDPTGAARAARAERLSVLDVTTIAGVGHAFPDGPRYTHLQNSRDNITGTLGVHNPVLQALGLVRPGQGAQRVEFSDPGVPDYPDYLAPHVLETYAPHIAAPSPLADGGSPDGADVSDPVEAASPSKP